MQHAIKKYVGFFYGLLATVAIMASLYAIGFIIIRDFYTFEVAFLFLFWWLVISWPFYKWHYIKKHKKRYSKALVLLLLLVVTMITDSYFDTADNPLTISLLVVFWMGVVYLAFPKFFLKYKWFILIPYGISTAHFIYVRVFSGDLEYYLNHEKGFALTLFMIPIPIVVVIWIYEQYKWLQSLKEEKASTELALLKSQINPHFFFNTLNNLYALTVKQSEQAPAVVLKLSEMMRYTIYEGKKELVDLNKEVDYMNNFIELHKIRYHRNVDISFNVEVDGNPRVAPLLFIILIENAIKHGVESMSEHAFVHISMQGNEKAINFEIENNYNPSERNSEIGIGMNNLKRRLVHTYKNDYSLDIKEADQLYKVQLTIQLHD